MSKAHVPFETTLFLRDACLCLNVQQAARALARRFDDALRPLELTNGQFSLLMSLNRAEPPRLGDVAQLLAMDRTTLTAALKPLQRRGLAAAKPDPQDKRSRRIALTAAGHQLLLRALPIWKRHHARLEKHLGAPNARRLAEELQFLTRLL
ncbi:MarR family transcriptional regulator [uncultured Methylovirgula sp.]|uniref:MarR family winged helix-turn-helix transcriptional regulator n=1 Tax=uncultured Methylovirgula sp. TaxID=1285960 RepID=UPI0026300801|nr:MarR family transcriptional regulator [uncultured Methylovirgula sp.]